MAFLIERLDELRENGLIIAEYDPGQEYVMPPKAIEAYKANPRPEKNFMLMVEWDQPPLANMLVPLITAYYGHPPKGVNTTLRLTYPTDTPVYSSQLWHRDPGGRRMIQVFLYLSDVTLDSGPFGYVRGSNADGKYGKVVPPQKDPIRVTDEEMRSVIPESEWLTITGPKHTLIVADTKGYHRGHKNLKEERLVLGLVYDGVLLRT